jgi:RNA polymerase sigma-70 factor (ECF subfamily)
MLSNTKFHTSRSPHRATAAPPEDASARAVHPSSVRHGMRSNYFPGADVANDCDRTLLTAIAAGDASALTKIHSRYHGRIHGFARRIIRRPDLAEEVANDTLWVIWQSAGRFEGASKISTWILGIAYRVSMSTLRSMRRQCPSATLMPDPNENAHEPRALDEVYEWVGVALALLPDEQRTALELSYGLGYSCKEIAESAKCPVGTVKTRMYHGRRKLRQLLPRLAGLANA